MTLADFIDANQRDIDAAIGRVLGHVPRTAPCSCPRSGTDHTHSIPALDNAERRLWILNDEGLYRWARSEGVKI